jgi:hypothetical protein
LNHLLARITARFIYFDPPLWRTDGSPFRGKYRYSEAGKKVRTNNHVERLNRWLRFWEKLRYKWRQRKWVLRFVLLALDQCWRQAAAAAQADKPARPEHRNQSSSA